MWKEWLVKAITNTQDKLEAAQACYKHNFDKRLHRNDEEINLVDQVYLRVDRKSDK